MYDELTEYLQGYICIDSIDAFTKSINEIGPYVSDLPIDTPLTVGELKNFTRVDVRRSSYREFHIPKKSGGTRTITAPDGRLKGIMRTISFMLNNLYDAPEEAKAFIPGRSIVDNAKLHINKNYVLNIDLSDFFTSITAYMVERSLTDIGIPPVVSQTMASICTYPTIDKGKLMNVLPQGAPCSPVLSNICAKISISPLPAVLVNMTVEKHPFQISFRGMNNRVMDQLLNEGIAKDGKFEGFYLQPIATALYQYSYMLRWKGINI